MPVSRDEYTPYLRDAKARELVLYLALYMSLEEEWLSGQEDTVPTDADLVRSIDTLISQARRLMGEANG